MSSRLIWYYVTELQYSAQFT